MKVTKDGERWAKWLNARVATRGAGGKMKQADLLRLLDEAGYPHTPSAVSRWLSGVRVGSPEVAAAVGEALGDRSGALRAAGYADLSTPPLERHVKGAAGEVIMFAHNKAELDEILAKSEDEMFAGGGMIIVIEPSNGR